MSDCDNGPPVDLYRLWCNPGNGWLLLYAGISVDWPRRMSEHRAHKPWWEFVDRVDIERFCCRRHAVEAEREAIRGEGPVHNVRHAVRAVL